MKRIGILSDTHGALPASLTDFFKDVDEIWHAGDIGSIDVATRLQAFKPLRAVYGNIDGTVVRQSFPENHIFICEQMKVLMTHIGGYPGKYDPLARALIASEKPDIFICGHSHILKVIYDQKYKLLHINPGAAGNSGLHRQITMVRCVIDLDRIRDLEIYDLLRANAM
ncbi:MAG: metallophosphoesterase family protein [Bacteroidales bacterium]|nr:metallophosphoesterase family protein [Bacteroidales bacterium]